MSDYTQCNIDRFEEIMGEIRCLCEEAYMLLEDTERSRSKAYWRGEIHTAIGGEYNDYCSDSTYSMNDALVDMRIC